MKKIILLLIFTASISYAENFTCSILQSGGDYNSITTWLTAMTNCDITHSTGTRVFNSTLTGTINDGTIVWGQTSKSTGTVVHVTSTQVLIRRIRTMSTQPFASGETVYLNGSNYVVLADSGNPVILLASIGGTWTSAEDKTGAIYLPVCPTSVDNYMKIQTTNSSRPSGLWDTTKYIIRSNNTDGSGEATFNVQNPANVWIDGLQIENYSSIPRGIRSNSTENFSISNCMLKCSYSDNNVYLASALYFDSGFTGTLKFWNNIMWNWSGGIVKPSNGGNFVIYNNTLFNCDMGNDDGEDAGIRIDNPTSEYLKNNYIESTHATPVCYKLTGTYTHSNNVSSDASSPDSTFRSKRASFLNGATNYFLLSSTDTVCIDTGTTLSGDAQLPFSTDILNNTRPSGTYWDIGANEYQYPVATIIRRKSRISGDMFQ